MPEKPKRRKNNKNKRNKNKCKQEPNKINSSLDVASGNVSENNIKQEQAVINETKSEDCSSIINNAKLNLEDPLTDITESDTQDLNSNTKKIPDLNTIELSASAEKVNDENSNCNVSCNIQEYVVESPEQTVRNKSKLDASVKSKSLDNDDVPKIVEITDDSNSQTGDDPVYNLVNSSNILVSDVDSDIEWEKTDDLLGVPAIDRSTIEEILSTTTIPLNSKYCEQGRSLTPEEEESLRNCLKKFPFTQPTSVDTSEIIIQTVQVINHGVKHRLRKKASADDFNLQRLGPSRILDVIDEEGSSESSKNSRRQSYLSEKKSDPEDLEDDVFEDNKKKERFIAKMSAKSFGKQISQKCLLVDAKIKEPEVTEARGEWTVTNVEKMTGAEVVYLTDTSSSTSSIYDNSEDGDEGMETDVSVRMITPTIEVTDTETLLNENFSLKLETGVDSKDESENGKLLDNSLDKSDSEVANNTHEIIVLSTDDIKTNLTVKDINLDNNVDGEPAADTENKSSSGGYDLEMKVLKCELNDAINNLIREVSSDSESSDKNAKDQILNRQDSSSSVGSSQCTAMYNPTHSSLNDVANIVHDDIGDCSTNTESKTNDFSRHVKDVFECVTGFSSHNKSEDQLNTQPPTLKVLCVKKIATFPYGDKILEELATVSKKLQNIAINQQSISSQETKEVKANITKRYNLKMPYYPLPDVSAIEKVSLSNQDTKKHVPPPVKPRNSSLKLSQDESHWVGIPTETDPVYVCLSPSQKMLMEKTNTVISKEEASQLVDMHQKYIDRRGYNEYYDKGHRNENQRLDNPPVVPFKSQTGSRLLALIRDPAVTNSIKAKNQIRVLDQIQNIKKNNDINKKYEPLNSKRELPDTFRPIPPPRTKKASSSFYESDESSDFTDSSLRSIKHERKFFHYSTGTLNKEIEKDITSIQNMHRYYTDIRDQARDQNCPRRPSLPKDLCDQQMEYIRKKEKEVEAEIRRLEQEKTNIPIFHKQSPKAPLMADTDVFNEKVTRSSSYSMLFKKDTLSNSAKLPDKIDKGKLSVFSSSQEELLRDKMYSEYVNQMAERQERKQKKVIKISNSNDKPALVSDNIFSSLPGLDILDSKVNNKIEKEFIWRARERWNKLGIKDPETEDEREESNKDVYKEPKVIEHKIKVIEGGEEKDVKKLPNHLQEFVHFTVKDTEQGKSSPGESSTGPASPHVLVLCAVIILVLAVGKYFLRLLRNK